MPELTSVRIDIRDHDGRIGGVGSTLGRGYELGELEALDEARRAHVVESARRGPLRCRGWPDCRVLTVWRALDEARRGVAAWGRRTTVQGGQQYTRRTTV